MAIHKLPEYVINRLKAWEVVNRPSSVIKELVENSLDAGAKSIEVNIVDGWKSMISVQDDWEWIQLSDMDLLLERYATSKINTDEDLLSISSYGFRWEALASISEVSKITIMSKTAYSEIWTKYTKRWNEQVINHVPVPFQHGTIVSVEDLFYNVPARLKFLKSAQTEFYYCYNYFVDVAIWHYDKNFVLKKNDKIIFDLKWCDSLIERIDDIYKKDWSNNLKPLEFEDESMRILWVLSDPSIRFWSADNIKIYVNSRPIQDKTIYRALMDAYRRQLTPWEYPLAVLMLDIKPDLVDVNVHPSKLQVKFVDTQAVYKNIYDSVATCLWDSKITDYSNNNFTSSRPFAQSENSSNSSNFQFSSGWYRWQNVFMGSGDLHNRPTTLFGQDDFSQSNVSAVSQWFEQEQQDVVFSNSQIWDYQVVWQLWNSYIVIQWQDSLYYVDQHALAERIAFEKMKKNTDFSKELLLQPVKFNVTDVADLEKKIEEINQFGFDCSLLTENMMVVYAVPKIFITYPVELEKLFNYILYLPEINFDHMLDGIYATKACKTSIKAWHKLSMDQMINLIQEWFENIDGMFVCQHGRPSFVKIDKKIIDELFDR